MSEIIKKFAKKVKKSLNYWILKNEDINFIIGTRQMIREYEETGNNIMNFHVPHIKITPKEKAIFFLVTFENTEAKTLSETVKFFIDKKLPILKLNLYKKNGIIPLNVVGNSNKRFPIDIENIEYIFEEFIRKNF